MEQKKRGRPVIYSSEEERKAAHCERQRAYYRRQQESFGKDIRYRRPLRELGDKNKIKSEEEAIPNPISLKAFASRLSLNSFHETAETQELFSNPLRGVTPPQDQNPHPVI